AAGDAATLVAQAEDALRRRDFERARAAAEQAAAIQPHDAAVHLVLGKIHAGAGRPADAVEELRRAQRLDPLLPAAYRLCGVALLGLERHPHLADAHDLYARILADRHDYERAFDEWDMTLRIAPEHTGAMKGLAFLYFKVGDLAQAESHLKAAKKVTPDDFTIEQALAMVRGGAEPAPPVPVAPPPAP